MGKIKKRKIYAMKWHFHVLGIIGLLIGVYGVISAVIYGNTIWYSYSAGL